MTGQDGFSRRAMLATPAILAFAGTACAQASEAVNGSKTLVAYLSRSGNTRVIAGTLHRALGTDLFEIRPARAYPEDYEQHVARAASERDSGVEPPLAALVAGIAAYDEIFLGFPIWGETVPAPIRTFLKNHDLRDKTVRPFITHGGYGVGNSLGVLASHAARSRIEEPFVMEAEQERRTLDRVREWLGRVEARGA